MVKVLKFGGTSVKNAEVISRIPDIINRSDFNLFIVVSAFAGITDKLVDITNSDRKQILEILNEIKKRHFDTSEELNVLAETKNYIEEELSEIENIANYLPLSPQLKDVVMSKGEVLSSYIIHKYLSKTGINIAHADSRKLLKTDDNFNQAEILFSETDTKIKKVIPDLFKDYQVVIAGGFISSDEKDRPTTLGRGGSDYSASIYAAALDAAELQIWTDVDGILTSDPRVIADVKRILKLSYSEAAELAYFGAKVLHPKTILPAVKKKIPVVVKNTYNPEGNGTYILPEKSNIKMIKAIAFRKGITSITISSNRMLGAYGFLSKVFQIFEKHKVPVDLVTTSEVSISVTIDDISKLQILENELETLGDVTVSKNNAIICAVGEGIKINAGIAGRLFNVLKGVNISMVSVGASEVNLSILVDENDLEKSLKLLHSEFFDGELDKDTFATE